MLGSLLLAGAAAVAWPTAVLADSHAMTAHAPAANAPAANALVVVRGRVVSQTSYWNAEQGQVESRSTLAVHYPVAGQVETQLDVFTLGGELPNGFGMAVSHQPALAQGEEVVLLLTPSPAHGAATYAIAGAEAGKYMVTDGAARNGAGAAVPLAELYAELRGATLAPSLPTDWPAREQALPAAAVAPGAAMRMDARAYVYNNYKWPTNAVTYTVNINSTQVDMGRGSADDFLASIRRAANTWTYLENADLSLVYGGPTTSTATGYNGANEILFVNGGTSDGAGGSRPLATTVVFYMNNTIVEADVKINDAYTWDATGRLAPTAFDLQSVLLHEMGHWLGLGHDDAAGAAMYDSIAMGTLKRTLAASDRTGIAAVYPCAPGSTCNPQAPADPPLDTTPVEEQENTTDPGPAVDPAQPGAALFLPLVQG
jgi:hypothetical protein